MITKLWERRTTNPLAILTVIAVGAATLFMGTATASPASAAYIPVNVGMSASNNSSQTAVVPVADGLTPRAIRGRITAPESNNGATLRSGTVAVYAGGQRVYLGPAAADTFSATLSNPTVTNGKLTVGLSYVVSDLQNDYCAANDQQIGLEDVSVDFTGSQTPPQTVADFLTPGVNGVNVLIPTDASQELVEAGLAAVSAATHVLESDAQVRLSTGALDRRITSIPGARVISITDAENPVSTSISTNSGLPQLNISGQGSELAQAATALGGKQLPLAGSATTKGLTQQIDSTEDLVQSFKMLGNSQPSLDGWGTQSIYVGADQSQFGGGIGDATVRIVGTHTAIPDNATATLNTYWNDSLIASQVLDKSTAIDYTAAVPNTAIEAQNGLRIVMSSVPAGGNCSVNQRAIPMGLTLDGGQSQVIAKRGQTLQQGFKRFPQALGGTLPVAFADGTSASQGAVEAALLVASLQRANSRQLTVEVVPFNDVVGTSATALVVGAGDAASNDLSSPLRLTEFRSLASQDMQFGVGVNAPYAALQAFASDNRNLIMLGSFAPNESSNAEAHKLSLSLAENAYSRSGGWNSLGDDILLAQPGEQPTALNSNSVIPQESVTGEYSSVVWWVLLVILLFVALGLWRYLSVRRSRKKIANYVDAQERADEQAFNEADGL